MNINELECGIEQMFFEYDIFSFFLANSSFTMIMIFDE